MPGKHDGNGRRTMAGAGGSASSVEALRTPVMALAGTMKASAAGQGVRRAASEATGYCVQARHD